jgi:tetratricopeptide (TPR) repeat protein
MSTAEVKEKRQEMGHKLTAEALALLGKKDYQGAVAALDAAIKFDPTNRDPYLLLGQILLKSGEFKRASEFLDMAAKMFPEDGMIFYMLSIAHKMDNEKLPAVLAARRSYELFKAAKDEENTQKAAELLEQVVNAPDGQVNNDSAKK